MNTAGVATLVLINHHLLLVIVSVLPNLSIQNGDDPNCPPQILMPTFARLSIRSPKSLQS